MWASPFAVALLNLCGTIPEKSVNYMPKDEALERLREYTKPDFGNDALAWDKWGIDHGMHYRGWSGIPGMLDPPSERILST